MPQSTKKKYKSHKRDNNLADLRRREKTNQLSDAEQAVLDKRREDVHEAVIKHRADNKPTVKNQLNALKIKFKRVNDENNQAQKDLLTFYDFMEKITTLVKDSPGLILRPSSANLRMSPSFTEQSRGFWIPNQS